MGLVSTSEIPVTPQLPVGKSFVDRCKMQIGNRNLRGEFDALTACKLGIANEVFEGLFTHPF